MSVAPRADQTRNGRRMLAPWRGRDQSFPNPRSTTYTLRSVLLIIAFRIFPYLLQTKNESFHQSFRIRINDNRRSPEGLSQAGLLYALQTRLMTSLRMRPQSRTPAVREPSAHPHSATIAAAAAASATWIVLSTRILHPATQTLIDCVKSKSVFYE
ncbi:hypothetical protein EVAR_59398_1 [Eumeta japonica]|uniref:Uncharacterized protein n=1 Tax=Eumeta variegata TaxID=151549 RepID=A0A4C1YN30_EUMVA|nr:hypothetical protein EVAR_59398_1 [Eumeta japonica]